MKIGILILAGIVGATLLVACGSPSSPKTDSAKIEDRAGRMPEKGLKIDPHVDCTHEYGNVQDHEVYVNGIKETCLYAACKKCSHVEHQYTHD